MGNKGILGLGNALTDIIVNVSENNIKELGLKKGNATVSTRCNMNSLEKILQEKTIECIPGGSPANTIANASILGAECGLIGTVGNDSVGDDYHQDLRKNKVNDYLYTAEGKSGRCYILVTPDCERTMIADIGVSKDFKIDFNKIPEYKIFHTSAYELKSNYEKTMEALEYAKKCNTEISFDLADSALIKKNKKAVMNAAKYANIVFANAEEAEAFTGLKCRRDIAKALVDLYEISVVKIGKDGSWIGSRKGMKCIGIEPCDVNVVNTNGAGDAYSAGFLFQYLNKKPLCVCGDYGSAVSAKICEKKGARLNSE